MSEELMLHMSEDDHTYKSIILIALEYAGETAKFHRHCKLGLCDKAPEYLKFHPFFEEVPFMETGYDDAGIVAIGANNIARFLAKCRFQPDGVTFYGKSLMEMVCIEQWIGYSTVFLYACAHNYCKIRDGIKSTVSVEQKNAMIMSNMKRIFKIFNSRLSSNTYFVGNGLTVADIIITCHLHFVFTKILVKSFTSQFCHVEKYFWNMVNQPNFKKILGNVKQFEVEETIQERENLGSSQPGSALRQGKQAHSPGPQHFWGLKILYFYLAII